MLNFLQSPSQITVPLWAYLLSALILVSGTWFAGWINRKRRSSQRSEDHKTDAEARRLEVESLADIYRQLREARAEIAAIVRAHVQEVRELKEQHASQEQFLKSQIEIRTESEYDAKEKEQRVRDRFHAASEELNRCTRRILEYEKILSQCNPPVAVVPFDFTPYREIMRAHQE